MLRRSFFSLLPAGLASLFVKQTPKTEELFFVFSNDKFYVKDGLVYKRENQGTIYHYDEQQRLHCETGPAMIRPDGHKEWYIHGKRHRIDGPAVEYANGDQHWCVNGKHHRTDGPAIEYANGTKSWWVNDNRHRIDGPAVEYGNGDQQWWVDGVFCAEYKHKEGSMTITDLKFELCVPKTLV